MKDEDTRKESWLTFWIPKDIIYQDSSNPDRHAQESWKEIFDELCNENGIHLDQLHIQRTIILFGS